MAREVVAELAKHRADTDPNYQPTSGQWRQHEIDDMERVIMAVALIIGRLVEADT